MDRLGFLGRGSRSPGVHTSGAAEDNTAPLSRRLARGAERDLESLQPRSEMAIRPEGNRSGALARLLPPLRTLLPNWTGESASRPLDPSPRTNSHGSRYATANVRGRCDTAESPKSTLFHISEQQLPSPRLHMTGLLRPWTQGSSRPSPSRSYLSSRSRPPTRLASGLASDRELSGQLRPGNGGYVLEPPGSTVAVPIPALHTERVDSPHPSRCRPIEDDDRLDELDGHNASRTRFNAVNSAEAELFALVEDGRRRRQHRRSRSTRPPRSHRPRLGRANGGSSSSAQNDRDREDRRRRHRRRQGQRPGPHSNPYTTSARGQRQRDRSAADAALQPPYPAPSRFFFCLPRIQSRKVRYQIVRCFFAGLVLALLLMTYLALSMTRNINNSELTVLLVLIILFVAIFLCYGLIRLCMLVVGNQRGGGASPEDDNDDDAGSSRGVRSSRRRAGPVFGPGGYAIPRQPIRVVLARDEEAAGLESETTKILPPAYGIWRESVRVDPNRIYWARNEAVVGFLEETQRGSARTGSGAGDALNARGSGRGSTPRPPSYASEDGVTYVVEAQPRLIAPTTNTLTVSGQQAHPSETGRVGRPAEW